MKELKTMWAACAGVALCVALAAAQGTPEGKKSTGQSQPGKAAAKKPSGKQAAGGQAMPMAPKPAPEIQRIIKAFSGTWDVSETLEPSEFMPQGGTSTGSDVAKAGPGGHSLIRDFRSKGALGSYSGHGVIYWDPKQQAYKYIWCDSMSAEGCEVGATGKWEGNDLIFSTEGEYMGKKYQMKLGYTDIQPDSYTFYIDQAIGGGPMKHTMTSKFTKKTSAKTAAAPTKK